MPHSVTTPNRRKNLISRRDMLRNGSFALTAATFAAATPRLSFGAEQALPKLSVMSFPGPAISSHPKVIIKKEGLDKKHGWDMDVVVRNSSEAYYNDFISGGFDAWDLGGVFALGRLAAKGVPLRIVRATLRYPFPMVARSESGIKSIKDLKGKKIGIDRATYIYAGLAEAARVNGFDLEKDAEIVNIGLLQAIPRLQRGDVDAVVLLFEMGLKLQMDAPNDYYIAFDCDTERARAIGVKSLYQYLAIRTDWLDAHKDLIPGVVASYTDMAGFFATQPRDAVKLLAVSRDDGGAELAEPIGTMEYVTGTSDGLKTQWTSLSAAELQGDIFRELDLYKRAGMLDELPNKNFIYGV